MKLKINNLTKKYNDKVAVSSTNLTLENGIYGLLGANGAGKTTLMRMIASILKPTSGNITLEGLPVNTEEYRDLLGYLPQDFGYYPEFKAIDFMICMASLKGLNKSKAKQKSTELLELVSLSDVANKKIKTFSGGMKRRLGIAQALLNNPKLLILDEPTTGLDPKERIRFRNLISQLGTDRIIILSTHIVSDVEDIANTILMMKSGQIIHSGSINEIMETIKDKVYECIINTSDFDIFCKKYPIINIRQQGDTSTIRLISDTMPAVDATLVKATLEDLYLYYFSEVK